MTNIFVEVLSHTSFFAIFIYFFYVYYVGYVQKNSYINELNILTEQPIELAVSLLPKSTLVFLEGIFSNPDTYFKSIVDTIEQNRSKYNNIVPQAFLYTIIFGSIGIFVSFVYAFYIGENLFHLLISNLISIIIIATSDLVIATIYGQFRLIDPEFLLSLVVAKEASGTYGICNTYARDALDNIFAPEWIQNIINQNYGE